MEQTEGTQQSGSSTPNDNLLNENVFSFVPNLDFSNGDHVTWTLVVLGWVVAILIALWQSRKSWQHLSHQKKESVKDEILNKLRHIEDAAILFWVSEARDTDVIELDRFARDIKTITSLARKVEALKGPVYCGATFKELRQAITQAPRNKELPKPVPYDDYRTNQIRSASRKLRLHYTD